MMELGQSGLNRGVGKNDRRAVYESPGGNGSEEGIPYRRVRSAARHSGLCGPRFEAGLRLLSVNIAGDEQAGP